MNRVCIYVGHDKDFQTIIQQILFDQWFTWAAGETTPLFYGGDSYELNLSDMVFCSTNKEVIAKYNLNVPIFDALEFFSLI